MVLKLARVIYVLNACIGNQNYIIHEKYSWLFTIDDYVANKIVSF